MYIPKNKKMKNLIAAAVLSICAIALSAPQSKAFELPCLADDQQVMRYNGSTLCLRDKDTADTQDDAYYLFTDHSNKTSLIIAQSQDGENLEVTVTEVGDRATYFMMIGPDGSIESEGNSAIYYRYQADVETMLTALSELSDSIDLASNLTGE
jgi:hypothetical protein